MGYSMQTIRTNNLILLLQSGLIFYTSGTKIILSGKYHGTLITNNSEIEMMRSWLIDNGVVESDIIVENKSRNVIENILYIGKIINTLNYVDRIFLFVDDQYIQKIKRLTGGLIKKDISIGKIKSNL